MDTAGGDPAEALVVVPFRTLAEAEQWARSVEDTYPDAPRLLTTSGGESVVFDPETGEVALELCFTGGWRAKFAGSGTVVIAQRSDARSASETGGSS